MEELIKLLSFGAIKNLLLMTNSTNKLMNSWLPMHPALYSPFDGDKIFNITSIGLSKMAKIMIDNSERSWNDESKGISYWNKGLYGACYGGNMNIVKMMIDNGANQWDRAMEYACKGGNIEIFNLLVHKGVNCVCNRLLYYACYGENMDIINRLIDMNSFPHRYYYDYDCWDSGLRGACRRGNINIVRLMIGKGASDWNGGLTSACDGGNFDIVRLMVEKGANSWNDGFEGACFSGNIDIVRLMIKGGANDWSKGLNIARGHGHADLTEFLTKLIQALG